jgi:hypothetical protein
LKSPKIGLKLGMVESGGGKKGNPGVHEGRERGREKDSMEVF